MQQSTSFVAGVLQPRFYERGGDETTRSLQLKSKAITSYLV
jgi:hypothetical protein